MKNYDYKDCAGITMLKGDCLQRMTEIDLGSIDMVLTDLPYGITACKWDSVIPFVPMWGNINSVVKKNAAVVLFGSEPFSSVLRMSNIKNYKYDWYWEKEKAGNFQLAKKRAMKRIEEICVFYSKQCTYNPQGIKNCNRVVKNNSTKGGSMLHMTSVEKRKEYVQQYTNYPNDRLNFKNEKGLHESQKPVPLLEYLIKTYTNEGDTVLDFTAGSFSTAIAAINTGRKFIGIEMDKDYFDVGVKRVKDHIDKIGLNHKCLYKIEEEIDIEEL